MRFPWNTHVTEATNDELRAFTAEYGRNAGFDRRDVEAKYRRVLARLDEMGSSYEDHEEAEADRLFERMNLLSEALWHPF